MEELYLKIEDFDNLDDELKEELEKYFEVEFEMKVVWEESFFDMINRANTEGLARQQAIAQQQAVRRYGKRTIK